MTGGRKKGFTTKVIKEHKGKQIEESGGHRTEGGEQ
jgi:hypothetical protein